MCFYSIISKAPWNFGLAPRCLQSVPYLRTCTCSPLQFLCQVRRQRLIVFFFLFLALGTNGFEMYCASISISFLPLEQTMHSILWFPVPNSFIYCLILYKIRVGLCRRYRLFICTGRIPILFDCMFCSCFSSTVMYSYLWICPIDRNRVQVSFWSIKILFSRVSSTLCPPARWIIRL